MLGRDGDQIEVEGTASAYEEGGSPAGVLYELHDVTEEARLRERLVQAEKSEALGTLVSGVAHDFNNLLTVIAGGIEVQMERGDGESRWLQSAHIATERAEGIVRQLLRFSRRGEPTRDPVDLAALARETVSLASETFDRRIELTMEAAEGLPAVIGDHGQLHQVLMNLLVNARDAVTERLERDPGDPGYRPRITVALEAGEPGAAGPPAPVALTVEDNGAGIPPRAAGPHLRPPSSPPGR